MGFQEEVEELAQVFQQRQALEAEIVKKLRTLAPELAPALVSRPSAKAGAGLKRPSAQGAFQPDAKKSRLSDPDARVQDIWRKCQNIVKSIMSKSKGKWFSEPVTDVIAPEYSKYVKTPMDLGLISNKLRENQYSDPRDFAADMRLVWSNCRTYNGIGSDVRTTGDLYSEDWEKRWQDSRIEALWDEIQLEKHPEVSRVIDTAHGVAVIRQYVQGAQSCAVHRLWC
jgi:Bromodomain